MRLGLCVLADNRHQTLLTVFDQAPDTAVDAFISPTATVVGRVNVQDRSSVGYGCVLRGDTNYIHVGAYSHILDGTSIQVKLDKNGAPGGTVIGNYATIGAPAPELDLDPLRLAHLSAVSSEGLFAGGIDRDLCGGCVFFRA